MVSEIEITLRALHSRHLNGIFAENVEDAKSKILDLIPKDAVVGIGDSTTLRQVCVIEELKKRGTIVFDGFDRDIVHTSMKESQTFHERRIKESTVCDIFLTGTNAVTKDGRLVNVDGVGNRVAGMFWGHPATIIVVGRNKIVTDLDEAFCRIRNVIAPTHLKIRTLELGGRRRETPCVITGKCHDCRTRDRACNIFTIIEGKPLWTDVNVIIIDEDLGLGWDESWSQARILKIIQNYKKHVWVPFESSETWQTNKLNAHTQTKKDQ